MNRSPTDTLISAMEEADKATGCIVIMQAENTELVWFSTSDKLSEKLGLIEAAKQCIIAGIKRDD